MLGYVTLGTSELASALTFNNSYTLTGGSLALSTGNIQVGNGFLATINTQLTGTNGLDALAQLTTENFFSLFRRAVPAAQ